MEEEEEGPGQEPPALASASLQAARAEENQSLGTTAMPARPGAEASAKIVAAVISP